MQRQCISMLDLLVKPSTKISKIFQDRCKSFSEASQIAPPKSFKAWFKVTFWHDRNVCIESILCLEVSGNETCRINGNMSVSVPGISVEIHSHIEEWIAQVKWELLPRHGAVLYAMGFYLLCMFWCTDTCRTSQEIKAIDLEWGCMAKTSMERLGRGG